MDQDSAICFADQLRDARGKALRDAEAFDEIIHVVERLGSFRLGAIENLWQYKVNLEELARQSALAIEIPANHPDVHVSFPRLYDLVRYARNDALHQGAVARRLTGQAIQLSLVLEDALRRGLNNMTVGDYMVRNVVCAEEWQPISFIRQQMLANSFSFLPVKVEKQWCLVSDLEIATFLGTNRNQRLAKTLKTSGMKLSPAKRCTPRTPLSSALEMLGRDQRPLVVCLDASGQSPIAGILTPFDLL
jgi:CBS domain-containing protein